MHDTQVDPRERPPHLLDGPRHLERERPRPGRRSGLARLPHADVRPRRGVREVAARDVVLRGRQGRREVVLDGAEGRPGEGHQPCHVPHEPRDAHVGECAGVAPVLGDPGMSDRRDDGAGRRQVELDETVVTQPGPRAQVASLHHRDPRCDATADTGPMLMAVSRAAAPIRVVASAGTVRRSARPRRHRADRRFRDPCRPRAPWTRPRSSAVGRSAPHHPRAIGVAVEAS